MGTPLHSPQNPTYLAACKLRGHRTRLAEGRFLIDGQREIERAHQAGISIERLFVCSELLTENARTSGQRPIPSLWDSCDVREVAPRLWPKLAYGDRREGMIALAVAPERSLDQLTVDASSLVVILEQVEKPGNVGAVVRTLDAVGGTAVVLADGNPDVFNPNTIRASAGSVFSIPVVAAGAEAILAWLRARRLSVIVTRVEAEHTCFQLDLRGPLALVLGNEARGVSDVWQAASTWQARLPMSGLADSLNVSVTAAVFLYEAWRQRHSP